MTTTSLSSETVVLVAGMFSPRVTFLPMAWRLRKAGYKTKLFSNRYWLKTPKENGQRLAQFLRNTQGQHIHLVGHSLGGVVIMNALAVNTDAPSDLRFTQGKVVLIASPIRGNAVAHRLHANRWLGWILGRSVTDGLLQCAPTQTDGRQVGIISGDSPAGFSSMVYKPSDAYDGLVKISETTLAGAKDTVCIPQSHALMLFSKLSTDLTQEFLQHSAFSAKEPAKKFAGKSS